jgi:ATP/maltotriose-dependent transcriptional regulator MalT
MDHAAFWNAVSDIREGPERECLILAVLAMIYQADVGSIPEALRIADELRQRVGETRDEFERLSLLTAIGDAYRIGDRHADAMELARQGLDVARATGSEHFEYTALVRIASLQIDAGYLDEAGEVYAILREMRMSANHEVYDISTDVFAGRLALAAGRVDDARTIAAEQWRRMHEGNDRSLWSLRSAAVLMMELHLHTNEGDLDEALLTELLEIHQATCAFPLHDRTAALIFLALSRSGRPEIGRRVLGDYLALHRRSTTPWSVAARRLGYPAADITVDASAPLPAIGAGTELP